MWIDQIVKKIRSILILKISNPFWSKVEYKENG